MKRGWSSPNVATLVSVLLVFIAGCLGGESGPPLPETVPVKGVISMDGEPLTNAQILFHPVGTTTGPGSHGGSDENGNFELKTGSGTSVVEGAAPGEYKVTVSRMVGPDGNPITRDPEKPPAMQMGRESLPIQYTGVDRTPLKVTIPEGGGEVKLEVKTE